ncbi:MAG: hypothetical protein ACLSHC_02310 [Bilophila wadsworthia]
MAWELTEEHPVVDLSLFRHRNFTVGTICISLGFLFLFRRVVMMPLMLQTRLGIPPCGPGSPSRPWDFPGLPLAAHRGSRSATTCGSSSL